MNLLTLENLVSFPFVGQVGSMPMDTITSTTLLEGLKDRQNQPAWQRFSERYYPMILSFAKKLGFNDSDAQDIAQETMLGFVRGYRSGQYDRTKGRLRSWLFGIAHKKVLSLQRGQGKERIISDASEGTGFLERIESPHGIEKAWEQEWERAVLGACLAEVAKEVEPKTYRCFELYVLKEWPVGRVAKELNLTEDAVYAAKSRVMRRIRMIQERMEEIW